MALIAVAQRDPGGADAALSQVSASNFGGDTIGHQMCRWAEAQVWLMRRKPRVAHEVLDQFDGAHTTSPRFLMVRGDILAALGHHSEAEDALHRALMAAGAVHARWLNWRIDASFGRLYASRRDASAAERSFAAARADVHELAMAIPDTALRDNFVQAALRSMPARRPSSERRLTKEQFGGLTMREREVAALVAAGLSNRAVAERLIVGERTVETYVSSILNKLAYGSRAQIAAWAVDKSLAKPS